MENPLSVQNAMYAHRNEMKENYKASVAEHKKGKLKFSDDIKELKKML